MEENLASGLLSAGIEFKINSTKIPGCKATPAMGSTPSKKDITSFDNKKMKTFVNGLMELGDLNFEFWSQSDAANEKAARQTAGTSGTNYEIVWPDGTTDSWTGTHQVYKNAASPDEPLSFVIAVSCESEPVNSADPVKTN